MVFIINSNSFAEQYIVDQLEAKLEARRASTVWLGGRVEDLRVQVEKNEEALEAARLGLSDASGQSLCHHAAQPARQQEGLDAEFDESCDGSRGVAGVDG